MADYLIKYIKELKSLIEHFGSVDKAYQKALHCKVPCHFKQGKKMLCKSLRQLKRLGYLEC